MSLLNPPPVRTVLLDKAGRLMHNWSTWFSKVADTKNDALVEGTFTFTNNFQTDQTAAGTVLGSVVKKLQIYDAQGNSLGFIAIYNTIT